jgi:hypothetical protein
MMQYIPAKNSKRTPIGQAVNTLAPTDVSATKTMAPQAGTGVPIPKAFVAEAGMTVVGVTTDVQTATGTIGQAESELILIHAVPGGLQFVRQLQFPRAAGIDILIDNAVKVARKLGFTLAERHDTIAAEAACEIT